MTEKTTKKKSRPQESSDSTALALPTGALVSVFDNFFEPIFRSPFSFWPELGAQEPSLDLQDRGDHFSLTVQLPGYSKDDLEVRVNSNSVELRAERNTQSKTKSETGNQMQRSYSLFHRYLSLPEQIIGGKADGTMKNGILELKLPKRQHRPGGSSRRVDLK